MGGRNKLSKPLVDKPSITERKTEKRKKKYKFRGERSFRTYPNDRKRKIVTRKKIILPSIVPLRILCFPNFDPINPAAESDNDKTKTENLKASIFTCQNIMAEIVGPKINKIDPNDLRFTFVILGRKFPFSATSSEMANIAAKTNVCGRFKKLGI